MKIKDLNDNKPVFTQSSYTIHLSGGSQIGKSILKVTATDEDDGSNGKVSYDLEESSDSNL